MTGYRGMWRAFTDAGRTADPHHPDLARFTTGQALTKLMAGLEASRQAGLIAIGDTILYPQVIGVSPPSRPAEIAISDCIDTRGTKRIRPSGPPFSDPPGGRRLIWAIVRLVDGTWKVTDFGVTRIGSCE